jgi:hypothetical protein
LDGGSARRKASTYTQNKRIKIFMLRVVFQPTSPVFKRAKTVHALDRAATVIGLHGIKKPKKKEAKVQRAVEP